MSCKKPKHCNLREKGKLPTHEHHHEVYDKVKFGHHDEGEAIRDYRTLRHHLKSPKSKRLITHIISEEEEHKQMFGKIASYECEARRKA